jgi:hypothetical protein
VCVVQVEPTTFTWGCYLLQSHAIGQPRAVTATWSTPNPECPHECMRYFLLCRHGVIIHCTVAAGVNQKVGGGSAAAAQGAQAMRKLCKNCDHNVGLCKILGYIHICRPTLFCRMKRKIVFELATSGGCPAQRLGARMATIHMHPKLRLAAASRGLLVHTTFSVCTNVLCSASPGRRTFPCLK